MGLGLLLSIPAAGFIWPNDSDYHRIADSICTAHRDLLDRFGKVILLLLMGFVWLRTGKIRRISPVNAIRGTWKKSQESKRTAFPIQKKGLTCWLALRQLLSGKRRYIGACMVAVYWCSSPLSLAG